MLLSYLKIAWKVLLRRKFFTFISLFGISFTLMILLVVMALADHVVGPNMPEKRLNRMLFVNTIRQQMVDDHGWMNNPASIHFVDRYVRRMKTPEKVGVMSNIYNATAFTPGGLLPLDLRYTDGNFWQIMDFEFLGGRAFTGAEVDQVQHVCIVNEATARSYFGTTQVVGRTIEIDLKRYQIAGVVRNVSAVHIASYSDVWVPYTLSPSLTRDNRIGGEFMVVLLAPSTAEMPAMREEYRQMMRRVEIPNPREVRALFSYADPMLATFTRALHITRAVSGSDSQTLDDDNVGAFYLICTVLGLLFMLLPALNLVNLNVTRILERSSEIGVRKAFGATSRNLVGQFLVENVVLAVVGGLLGLALAAGALALLNDVHVVAYAQFSLSWRVFAWGLLLTLVFGLMSGVYPAWKMSRLNPVVALRGSGEQK
ncbi:ABC transporter permease [Microvirga sp. STR05]|uniref:ABC transporter permease n=1 Tax=Hymenobacter duratus TaxID=2771356 RepID=A0ABR8JDP6_9BACT|nr:ABC transporter permease [Hymenobacter duratus]MBD2714967.1 ABC transporter permease [Hymenobacter duratus]MBR7949873.1 ABC transporter permease [Microvirga sp. STR05]